MNRNKHIVDLDSLREEVPAILRGSQMTVLEIWKQHIALDCHIIGSCQKHFRPKLPCAIMNCLITYGIDHVKQVAFFKYGIFETVKIYLFSGAP